MQLIVILLATVGILTFLSGVIVLFGSSKSDRIRSLCFFLASVFSTIWMSVIAVFVSLRPGTDLQLQLMARLTFPFVIMLDVAFLGYVVWGKKYGKIITIIYLIAGLIISGFIIANPDALGVVSVESSGNRIVMNNSSPLFVAYVLYFCAVLPTISLAYLREFLRSRSKRKRRGTLINMVVFGLSSLVVLVCNLILPLVGNCYGVWLGPLALGTVIIVVYYTTLRYQSLNLSYMWIRFFSYVVVVCSIAIVYMMIFYIIFAALFQGSTPSTQVIILNFIMVLIFIALMPAMSGLTKLINSLISEQHPHRSKQSVMPGLDELQNPSTLIEHKPRAKATTKSKKEHRHR